MASSSRTLQPIETVLGLEFLDQHRVLAGSILRNERNLPPEIDQGIRQYRLRYGDLVTAYTDIGHGRERNDDRIVIDRQRNLVSVNDGYGEDGGKAADLLAEHQIYEPDLRTAITLAHEAIEASAPDGGVCMMQCEILFGDDGEKHLQSVQAGDVRRITTETPKRSWIFWKRRELAEQSVDQTRAEEFAAAGVIPRDRVACHPERNVVTNSVNPYGGTLNITRKKKPLQAGQRIYVLSDGISDNLTTDEILALTGGLPPEKAIQTLIRITDARMKWLIENNEQVIDHLAFELVDRQNGRRAKFSDGFVSPPKTDNRSVAIIDIA